MSIASELEDLATNLQAAKSAITALGGTVGDTGLAGLASEIRTIPVEPGPEPGQEPYGVQDVNATGSVANNTLYYPSLEGGEVVNINAGTSIWVIAEWDDGTTNPPLSRYYQFSWAEGGIVVGYISIADVVFEEPPQPPEPEPEPDQPFVVDSDGITNNFAEVYATYSTDFPSGVILELGHMVYVPDGITAGGVTFYQVMESDRMTYIGYVLAEYVDIMNAQDPGGEQPVDPGMEDPGVQEPVQDPGMEDPNSGQINPGEGEQENPEPVIEPEIEPEP